jgi:hypothetical protein
MQISLIDSRTVTVIMAKTIANRILPGPCQQKTGSQVQGSRLRVQGFSGS